ncbi:hypothetical protein CAPTEDRAFT_193008 [Capitella teleta]|uniref:Uncharacterized protein n=1 Tax=Capitella teleta TaxID=283909 RepID=R7TLK8_CAPTE|nr:hypothetical protein CAPTEDRAFT_193008 [Capitella teleta]|eukprot:ELT94382.1 hypothetical protein CAPTEDRAFT_193008 [Capitella teleta]
MEQSKAFYAVAGGCLVFMVLIVGFQFVDQKKLTESSIVRAIMPTQDKSPLAPRAPANAGGVDFTYNPFTREGHSFWSSVVRMDITPGIFDDCNKIDGGLKSSRPMPAMFYKTYDEYTKKLADISKGMTREGTSLAYPEESLVLWNIISKVPYIKTVCETGFNTGEGTVLWLTARPDVHVYSFDIGGHPYAKPMAKHVQELFPGRHNITWGDSTKTLPVFIKNNPGILCDIIYVDGGHTYGISKTDFENFSKRVLIISAAFVVDT